MNASWTSPPSQLGMNTHPPQHNVLTTPQIATNAARLLPCARESRYDTKTRRRRGPDVRAMRIWKTCRSGAQSPIVLFPRVFEKGVLFGSPGVRGRGRARRRRGTTRRDSPSATGSVHIQLSPIPLSTYEDREHLVLDNLVVVQPGSNSKRGKECSWTRTLVRRSLGG